MSAPDSYRATVVDPGGPLDGQTVELSIAGKKATLATSKKAAPGLYLTPGWLDLLATIPDPGYEAAETLQTGLAAAFAGGFTDVVLHSFDGQAYDQKSTLDYVKVHSGLWGPAVHLTAAITDGNEGLAITEMLDLARHGAVAFSDGYAVMHHPDVLLKALQYSHQAGKPLMVVPRDAHLGSLGVMHEGETSTRLGLPGIPALAEVTAIKRDLDILRYAGGRLHFSQVSTAEGVRLIKAAKREGLQVTAGVSALHLLFTDEDMVPFDAQYKLQVPLRSSADRRALRQAVNDGTVTAIVSAHFPLHADEKEKEFDMALPGAIGFGTVAPVVGRLVQEGKLDTVAALTALTAGPRQTLGRPPDHLAEGELKTFTLLDTQKQWTLFRENSPSLAENSPLWGQTLSGGIVAAKAGKRLYHPKPVSAS